ncbi:MAG: hypothetical protein JWN48_4599 [Myxococcaceae bacterium]|nr:hypothetical protein [Myxococcaceae bacterium]
MSSISLSLKLLLASSALGGLTLLACGGDDSGSTKDNSGPSTGSKSDASVKKDSGATTKKDAGSAIPTGAVEGEDCTGIGGMCDNDACEKAPCFAACVDGTYGACDTLNNLLPDAGRPSGNILPDGSTVSVTDAGVRVTLPGSDASIDIPATACPAKFSCNDIGKLINAPLNFCSAPGAFTPPSCSTTQDCIDMGFKATSAMCGTIPVIGGMACLQACTLP